MLIKLVAVQARVGCPLSQVEKIHIFKQRPDFVCLPEYWLMDDRITDHHRAALYHAEQTEYLKRLSEELRTTLIGGTTVMPVGDLLYNSCQVFSRGKFLGRYFKRRLMPGEQKAGLTPGDAPFVLEIDSVRVAVMICSDVFAPEFYDELINERVDLVFVPTASPRREDDRPSEKAHRDKTYFVAGADRAGAFVIKVCGIGELFGRPLQGRTLIAAPWGILNPARVDAEDSVRIVSETLDTDELRDFCLKRSTKGK